MELNTTHFGTLHFQEEDVLTFGAGVPGFWHATRFLLLPDAKNQAIHYLQSADIPNLRFILVGALKVMPEYDLSIEPWDAQNLLLPGELPSTDPLRRSDWDSWFIISTPQPNRLTINMLAPVVISRKSRRGVQAVRSDTRYSHAFPLDSAALELARRHTC